MVALRCEKPKYCVRSECKNERFSKINRSVSVPRAELELMNLKLSDVKDAHRQIRSVLKKRAVNRHDCSFNMPDDSEKDRTYALEKKAELTGVSE